VQTLTSPPPTSHKPEQPRIHPFALLSEEQKLIFVARVLFVIFTVYMKQMKEEREQQQDQEPRQQSEEDHHQDQEQHLNVTPIFSHQSAMPSSKDTTSSTKYPHLNPITRPGADDATTPDRVHQGSLEAPDDTNLEDSDDEDGGVALSGTGLGALPPRISTKREKRMGQMETPTWTDSHQHIVSAPETALNSWSRT
jgi:hypothetical protein